MLHANDWRTSGVSSSRCAAKRMKEGEVGTSLALEWQ